MSENLIEESLASARRFFALGAVRVQKGMFGEAGLANDLGYFPVHQARHGMVQQKFTAWAVIVNQVA
jgi:hypothetical protein